MTEKLFWKDPYQREFSASVVERFQTEDGHVLILDRTCFYATSGGQPNDLGSINNVRVKDVRAENNKLIHVLDEPVPSDEVTGKIDWVRRFDHMQQHSGQHILSAAFFRLFHAETSSFHLGEDLCSIELSRTDLKDEQIQQAEQKANEIVISAAPVSSFFVEADRASEYPLRKQSDLAESLRIIQIADFDLSPCSGTHVQNTGEIGMIFIHSFEKLSRTIKINFVSGNRVRTRYHRELSVLKSVSKSLTTSFELIPESVTRLQSQVKELRKENMQLKEKRLKAEAMELVVKSEHWKDYHLVVKLWDRPFEELRYMAQRLSEQPGMVGVLVSRQEGRCVFFKHPDVKVELKPLFTQFINNASGRGGGPPHFMEAGNLKLNQNTEDELHSLFV